MPELDALPAAMTDTFRTQCARLLGVDAPILMLPDAFGAAAPAPRAQALYEAMCLRAAAIGPMLPALQAHVFPQPDRKSVV